MHTELTVIRCIVDFCIFKLLNVFSEYLKDIVRNCGVKSFKRDDIIIEQGERGDW